MLNFPFNSTRPGQQEMMDRIESCLAERKSLLVHAPTGIGKTVSALYPAVKFAQENGLTVFFLTPRHSQHIIAISTLRKMGEVKATDIVGKPHLCNYVHDDFGPTDFHELCNYLKKGDRCNYYNNVLKNGELSPDAILKVKSLSSKILAADELKQVCTGMCPYEISCFLARGSDVIIADYFHLFSPSVADTFLAKVKKKLDKSIIIVDEGHQLPSRVRDLISAKLTEYVLEKATQEAKELRNPVYADIITLDSSIRRRMREKLEDEDEVYIEKDDLTELFKSMGLEFLEELRNISEQSREAGKKRSFCFSLLNFIETWNESGENFARVAKKIRAHLGEKYEVRLTALLPSAISSQVISESHATILMSATLQPLKMYADILGFKNYETISLKGVFPRENRLNIIAPIATTRYKERGDEQYRNYASIIEKICSNIRGNVAVFFPSYYFLQQVEQNLTHGEKFIEDPEQTKDQKFALLNAFILSSEGLLMGVQGGSFDQGIDFPNNVLKGVIIAGISLAKPDLETKSLIECYDRHYGKGMEYGYVYPAVQKAIQASGRAIRTEKDKAVVIYLDERFMWANYRPVFADQGFVISKEPWEKVKEMKWE